MDHQHFDIDYIKTFGLSLQPSKNSILKVKHYLLKLFLPWILPSVDSVITLDLDIFVQTDLIYLHRLGLEIFSQYQETLFLYVGENSFIYEKAYDNLGLNGGVVIYNTKHMRESNLYGHFLRYYPNFIGSDCFFDEVKGINLQYINVCGI